MARDFFINGESMVYVKGRSDSLIGSLQQLGLSDDQIRVSPRFRHQDIAVNAWGAGHVPVDVQAMLLDAIITMTLVHVDTTVLDAVEQESAGGAPTVGGLARTGQRMGNNQARFAAGSTGNHYIGLNIASPGGGKPWRFLYTYLLDAQEITLGNERSIFALTWRAIGYTNDPWGGGSAQPGTSAGTGSFGGVLWDHTLDT